MKKVCSTSEQYLGGTTFPRPSITWKRLQLLLQAIQWPSQSPGSFFVLSDKKFLQESAKVEETFLLTIFGKKFTEQLAPAQNLCQNSMLYILPTNFNFSSDMHHFEAIRKRYVLDKAKNSFENQILHKSIRSNFAKNQKNFGSKFKVTSVSYSIAWRLLRSRTGDIGPDNCDKVTLALYKKLGFQLTSRKNSATVNYDTAIANKWETSASNDCICRNWASKLKSAVGHAGCPNCFEKFQKFQPFFWQKTDLTKNVLAKKITSRHTIELCSIF